jgi:formylglycine-generating enzyme required for sulfatase activity
MPIRLKSAGISFLCFLFAHVLIAQGADPEMVFVRGGKFKMGSVVGGSDEQPVHEVILDDFYIGRFEVTQRQWRLIMDSDTNRFYFEVCDSCPAERISWNDVQRYIGKLNEKTKKNYRLPTEAEWEFAAKGGLLSKDYKYSGSNTDTAVAWKVGNSDAMTHPVGRKKPNELGVYDMTGNVFEWCADWYDPAWYAVAPLRNPAGPPQGTFRTVRGGSWFYDFAGLITSDRESANPSFRYGYIGFRLCRSAGEGKQSQAVPETVDSAELKKRAFYKKFIGF